METQIPVHLDLVERVNRFAELSSRSLLHPRVVAVLDALTTEERVAVGCSGGADSVAALCFIWAHFPKLRDRLRVFHFNHGLRGEASDEDESFVTEMSAGLGIKVVADSWKRYLGESAPSEAEARSERLAFFLNAARAERCTAIVLGHHADDVLETQLMRLARGQGSHGLSSPRPLQAFGEVRMLRPLLNLSKQTLVATLSKAGISWREDGSNSTADYTRNRLRRDVIPLLREIIPQDPVLGAARARELLEMEDAALNAQLETFLPGSSRELAAGTQLDLAPLINAPEAIIHRALHRWLDANALHDYLCREGVDAILDGITRLIHTEDPAQRSGRWSVGPFFVVLRQSMLTLEINAPKPAQDIPLISLVLSCGEALTWPNGGELHCEVVNLNEELLQQIMTGKADPRKESWIDFDTFTMSRETDEARDDTEVRLQVRNWQAGDAYQPLGSPGKRKLQDLFTDKKIPPRERRRLPIVLAYNNRIIWVPGFPPAQVFSLGKASVTALRLTYQSG